MINTTEKLRKEFNFKSPLLYAVVLGHEGEMPGEPKALMSMLNYLPENEDTLCQTPVKVVRTRIV